MNSTRRRQLMQIADQVEKTESLVDDLVEMLERLRDEEQEYLEAMPENLHGSEKHGDAEEAIESLNQAIENLRGLESSEDLIRSAAGE